MDKPDSAGLRLPGGGAVADGGQGDLMLFDERQHGFAGGGHLALAGQGIDHPGVQQVPHGVHYRQLAAGADARVHPQYHVAPDGRLHEQIVQVGCKYPDGRFLGGFRQLGAGLPLHGGQDQPAIGVLGRGLHQGGRRGPGLEAALGHGLQGGAFRQLQRHLQEAFPLPPVHCQHPVACHGPHRLRKVVIHPVYGILLLGGLGMDAALLGDELAQPGPDLGIVAVGFRQDVPGPCQGIRRGGYPQGFVHIGRR